MCIHGRHIILLSPFYALLTLCGYPVFSSQSYSNDTFCLITKLCLNSIGHKRKSRRLFQEQVFLRSEINVYALSDDLNSLREHSINLH